jgi:hypothetical protein
MVHIEFYEAAATVTPLLHGMTTFGLGWGLSTVLLSFGAGTIKDLYSGTEESSGTAAALITFVAALAVMVGTVFFLQP